MFAFPCWCSPVCQVRIWKAAFPPEWLGVESWTAFLCTSTKPIILRRNYDGDSPSCVIVCEHYVYLGLNTYATAPIKKWWCLLFINFCSKLTKPGKICVHRQTGTLCYHKKVPGVWCQLLPAVRVEAWNRCSAQGPSLGFPEQES